MDIQQRKYKTVSGFGSTEAFRSTLAKYLSCETNKLSTAGLNSTHSNKLNRSGNMVLYAIVVISINNE